MQDCMFCTFTPSDAPCPVPTAPYLPVCHCWLSTLSGQRRHSAVLRLSSAVATFEWILFALFMQIYDCSRDDATQLCPPLLLLLLHFHFGHSTAWQLMLMLRFIANLRDNKNELSKGSSSYSLITGGSWGTGGTWRVRNRQPDRRVGGHWHGQS